MNISELSNANLYRMACCLEEIRAKYVDLKNNPDEEEAQLAKTAELKELLDLFLDGLKIRAFNPRVLKATLIDGNHTPVSGILYLSNTGSLVWEKDPKHMRLTTLTIDDLTGQQVKELYSVVDAVVIPPKDQRVRRGDVPVETVVSIEQARLAAQ